MRVPILFFIHPSSTLAQVRVAIFCHKRGASTLPWRKHRLKTKLLSTRSNNAFTFQPRHLSQEGHNQTTVCLMVFQNFRHVPRPRLIESCLYVHCWPNTLWSTLHFDDSARELRPSAIHNVIVADLMPSLAGVDNIFHSNIPHAISSNLLVPSLALSAENTRCVQLRNYRCERNGTVASDLVLWFCIWFPQEDQFHNLPRAWRLHLALEAPRDKKDLLQVQLLHHLAHDCSSGPLTLLSLILALACSTKSPVISALRPSTVNCWSPIFTCSSKDQLLSFPPDQCVLLHNASAVPCAILLCSL